MMNVMDLFSGIGGFSLGLERAGGFKTTSFCEIDPYCRKVLAKHWPNVPIHEDVTKREYHEGEADVITAGFPCQDISFAGKGAGITGERSGLWREVVRAVRVVRPRYILLENVAALLSRGLGDVLGDLASIGYDAEWDCIPASAVGAPHRRDRIWLTAHAKRPRLERHQFLRTELRKLAAKTSAKFGNRVVPCGVQWPSLGKHLGMGNGISREVDRLRGLGNAVVPQIPELIGRAILESER